MSWFTATQGDAVEVLRALPDASIDLIVTDPAYESLEKHRATGTTTRLKQSDGSSNEWFQIFPNRRFAELFVECYRVLKRNAHMYVMCDLDTARFLDPVPVILGEDIDVIVGPAAQAGFVCWNWIVWDKLKIGMGYHYRKRKEFVLFFEKGKRKLNNLGTPDVLEEMDDVQPGERGVQMIGEARVHAGYPTEKPVKLNRVLIEQSTFPGEIVCDPFMGSGSCGEACGRSGRHFVGSDLSPKSVSSTVSRLSVVGMELKYLREAGLTHQQSRLL